jgi:FHS family glucose/mannose:H+ symporter-like MFS transporter
MMELTTSKINTAKATTVTPKLITFGTFAAFFLFGFVENIKGPTLPSLLSDLNFSYSMGAWIMLGGSFGFLAATLSAGPLSDRIGMKIVILVAIGCLFFGMTGYSLYRSVFSLMGLMMLIGFGFGTLEVSGHLIMIDVHPINKGRYLNLLAFFYGLGAMIAPLYAGKLLDAAFSWRRIYQLSAIPVFLLFFHFLMVKFPPKTTARPHEVDSKTMGQSVVSLKMFLFYFCITIYVAVEIGTGTWLVEFLQKTKGQSVMMSSWFLALFFFSLTLGRLIGSFVVERMGYYKILLYASMGVTVCVAIGTFTSPAFAFFLPLSGFFFSIIFPTIAAAVSDLNRTNSATIFGILFGFAGLGSMLGPWAIGLFSDWFGIQAGFAVVTILGAAVWSTCWVLYRLSFRPA